AQNIRQKVSGVTAGIMSATKAATSPTAVRMVKAMNDGRIRLKPRFHSKTQREKASKLGATQRKFQRNECACSMAVTQYTAKLLQVATIWQSCPVFVRSAILMR